MLYRVENIVIKGEIAVTSNFSFSHNILHSYISYVRQNVALYGNGLTHFKAYSRKGVLKILKIAFFNNKNIHICFIAVTSMWQK